MNNKFVITKRSSLKGDDGYKVFSIRIRQETAAKLDKICQETNYSRNELIGKMLDWAINNTEIRDEQYI